MTKSPFIIQDGVITPLECENILNDLIVGEFIDEFTSQYKSQHVLDETNLQYIVNIAKSLFSTINSHYDVKCHKIENIGFTYGKHRCEASLFKSFNSVFYNNVWVRNEFNDFTLTIFLTSFHHNKEPIDTEFESHGGAFQFPQHNTSIYPDRGGVLIHPSDNHFMRNHTAIDNGTLCFIDVTISCDGLYFYDPFKFTNGESK